MAISFKKLVNDDEEEELETSVADKESVEIREEEHPAPKRKRFTLAGRVSRPRGVFGKKSCSRLSSWSVAFIAITVFTIAVVLSLFIALLLAEPTEPPSAPTSSTGAIAADSSMCSKMGGETLQAGGSAVDAAIVALLCVGTIYPESSGIGGGGFMTVFDPSNNTVKAIDFREAAPAAANVNMFHGNGNLSKFGGLAVCVPGELAGMKLAHDQYGRLPWADLFEPVIALARDGYPLSEHTAASIRRVEPGLWSNSRFRDWYYRSNGTLKSVGELIQRPKFAEVLKEIATEGPDAFYKGRIAREIVDEVQKQNGILTLTDMSSYKALIEDPVYIRYNDFDVYSVPLPSGGPQMLFILNVMEDMNLSPASQWENLTYQHLVESFRYSFAFRGKFGDPHCPSCDKDRLLKLQAQLLSEDFAAVINKSISNDRTFPPSHYNASSFVDDSGTTHVSVIDNDGMAVAVTSSVNTLFGSLVITPRGIVLNNEMDDFSSPNITNVYGIPPHEANFISPGKRPQSSTCPTLMLKNDSNGQYYPYLAIGAAGGTHIITSTAQVALEVTAFRDTVTKAVESKRLHDQLYPNVVQYEAGYPANITAYLKSLGHNVTLFSGKSEVQAVAQETRGVLTAHSDSRKGKESGSFVYRT